jgi:hypothetical protein
MQRKFLFSMMIGLMLLVSSASVAACGGFFCQNVPIDQSAERIIFTVNGDDTITAVIGIQYEGAAEDFSWLLPVPSVPEVDVAEQSALDTIQSVTNRSFTAPTNYCPDISYCDCGGGGGGGGGPITGSAGPYDYVILTEDDTDFVIEWLREFGYRVTDDMIPLIEYYVVVEKMEILAMRLSQGYEAGDIQPVKLTYQAENPMIPIILTSCCWARADRAARGASEHGFRRDGFEHRLTRATAPAERRSAGLRPRSSATVRETSTANPAPAQRSHRSPRAGNRAS